MKTSLDPSMQGGVPRVYRIAEQSTMYDVLRKDWFAGTVTIDYYAKLFLSLFGKEAFGDLQVNAAKKGKSKRNIHTFP